MSPNPAWRLAAAAAVLLTLGGCVIAPLGPRHGGYAYDDGPVVDIEPPPPRYESAPPAPGPAYVWIGGQCRWQLGRHVWIGGRWALPPAGQVWVPGLWHRHDRGWRWRDGRWGRR